MPEGIDRPEPDGSPLAAPPDTPPPAADHPEAFDKSIATLLRELFQDINHLVRQEIALAKAEMNEKMVTIAGAAGLMAAAAFLAVLAIFVLTAAIVLVVALWWPAWAAALVVAGAYLVIAGILVLIGRARLQKLGKPVPEQTVETIKEDVQWAKERTQSAKTSSWRGSGWGTTWTPWATGWTSRPECATSTPSTPPPSSAEAPG